MSISRAERLINSAVCLTTGHSLVQSEFSTECDLVLPLSNFQYSLLYQGHPVCAYVFLLVSHSLLPYILFSVTCFRRQFICRKWPIQLQSFFLLFVDYSFPPWLCVTLSYFTRSVQLVFSILPQQHISKLSMYFWSTFRSAQLSAPYRDADKSLARSGRKQATATKL